MDRHLRKLDQELAKFKMELEADNAGITEILERRESGIQNTALNSSNCLTPIMQPIIQRIQTNKAANSQCLSFIEQHMNMNPG